MYVIIVCFLNTTKKYGQFLSIAGFVYFKFIFCTCIIFLSLLLPVMTYLFFKYEKKYKAK